MKDAAYYRAYRLRKKQQGVVAPLSRGVSQTAMSMKAWSAYDAANWSTNRGWIYFPTLDTRRDLDDYSLIELRRKSRWLYNNVGLATRIIDGISNMVGALTPVPQTDDKEWNQLALKSFNQNAGAEFVFDQSGKFNFWSAQKMMTRARLLMGDVLAVLTETQSGIASCMFYEAHQIGNADGVDYQDQWQSGVRVTPQNRAIQYRILTPDGTKSVDIDAANAVLLADLKWPCRQRGEPIMRHAINNLLDRSEILGFVKTSMKNAAQIGYQIVRTPTFTGPGGLPALGTGPVDFTMGDGVTKVKVEDAYKAGKVPVMNPGEEIKLLLDQRPHPNQVEGMDYLVRDICAGTPFSADLLWNLAKLGGATMRYALADAQKGVEAEQTLNIDLFCSRFWVYYIAKELKNGRLRKCQDPEWWKHGWQPELKITVDIGRDGKLFLDMHKSGLVSDKRFHAMLGQNWQHEVDDYLEGRKYIVDKVAELGMTWDQAYPPEPGVQTIRETQTEKQSPEEQVQKTTGGQASNDNMNAKDVIKLIGAMKQGPSTTFNIPPIHMPQPIINATLPEQKAPIVHVHVPANPPPIVNVPAPHVNVFSPPTQKARSIKVKRDSEGKIEGIEAEKE